MLTENEEYTLEMLGEIAGMIRNHIILQAGKTSLQDFQEAMMHIHALQNMILAQSAARTYPDKYRLLGGTVNVD